jgi:hypothetical protein
LADKYGRHVQAITQFSARSSAEIAHRRQVLQGELSAETAQLWITDKVTRAAWHQKLAEEFDGHFDS